MKVAYAEWLDDQCRRVPDVARGALVVLDDSDAARPRYEVASWPTTTSARVSRTLLNAAHTALREQRPSWEAAPATEGGEPVTVIAFPVLDGERAKSAVSLELRSGTDQRRTEILQMLDAGARQLAKTLAAQHPSETHQADAPAQQHAAFALRILALILDGHGFDASLSALLRALQTELALERVSYGRRAAGRMTLTRTADSTTVEMRSRTGRYIESAMAEAVEQDATLAFPLLEGRQFDLRAQHELARETDHEVCTLPLVYRDELVGVLQFERRRHGATAFDLDLIEQIAALVTPVLHLKQREERPLTDRWRDAARDCLVWAAGPGYTGVKLALVTLGMLILVSAYVPASFEVTAHAALEARVRHAVVAPADGYVANSGKRAGDRVVAGDPLATLELRDLELALEKWSRELDTVGQEHSAAMTIGDRATMRTLEARQDQARTRMRKADELLARAHLAAPIDGVVITGDLSGAYGTPVQRGELLFEIAPLDGYRVVLQVDERDIIHVAPSQRGRLALTGLAAEPVEFEVLNIFPIAQNGDGRSFFKVEVELDAPSPALRPGMSGIAKIGIGERPLLWTWTRRLIDWTQLRLWEWGW